jgi:hypothetical protein
MNPSLDVVGQTRRRHPLIDGFFSPWVFLFQNLKHLTSQERPACVSDQRDHQAKLNFRNYVLISQNYLFHPDKILQTMK